MLTDIQKCISYIKKFDYIKLAKCDNCKKKFYINEYIVMIVRDIHYPECPKCGCFSLNNKICLKEIIKKG